MRSCEFEDFRLKETLLFRGIIRLEDFVPGFHLPVFSKELTGCTLYVQEVDTFGNVLNFLLWAGEGGDVCSLPHVLYQQVGAPSLIAFEYEAGRLEIGPKRQIERVVAECLKNNAMVGRPFLRASLANFCNDTATEHEANIAAVSSLHKLKETQRYIQRNVLCRDRIRDTLPEPLRSVRFQIDVSGDAMVVRVSEYLDDLSIQAMASAVASGRSEFAKILGVTSLRTKLLVQETGISLQHGRDLAERVLGVDERKIVSRFVHRIEQVIRQKSKSSRNFTERKMCADFADALMRREIHLDLDSVRDLLKALFEFSERAFELANTTAFTETILPFVEGMRETRPNDFDLEHRWATSSSARAIQSVNPEAARQRLLKAVKDGEILVETDRRSQTWLFCTLIELFLSYDVALSTERDWCLQAAERVFGKEADISARKRMLWTALRTLDRQSPTKDSLFSEELPSFLYYLMDVNGISDPTFVATLPIMFERALGMQELPVEHLAAAEILDRIFAFRQRDKHVKSSHLNVLYKFLNRAIYTLLMIECSCNVDSYLLSDHVSLWRQLWLDNKSKEIIAAEGILHFEDQLHKMYYELLMTRERDRFLERVASMRKTLAKKIRLKFPPEAHH